MLELLSKSDLIIKVNVLQDQVHSLTDIIRRQAETIETLKTSNLIPLRGKVS